MGASYTSFNLKCLHCDCFWSTVDSVGGTIASHQRHMCRLEMFANVVQAARTHQSSQMNCQPGQVTNRLASMELRRCKTPFLSSQGPCIVSDIYHATVKTDLESAEQTLQRAYICTNLIERAAVVQMPL